MESNPQKWQIFLLGLFHLLWALICGYLVYNTWPDLKTFETLKMKEILYLVMLAGATGSFIHSAGSFINYVGNEQLKITWFWWYLLRPFLGIAVAVIFFVLFYSGYLKEIETTDSPYGFLAFCTLAGTFSDLATLKLKEIFEALFNPRDKRADKLSGSKKDTDFEESNAQG